MKTKKDKSVSITFLRVNSEVTQAREDRDSPDSVFYRLEHTPEKLTDEQLRTLSRVHEHARGRNSHIPAKCFLILDARHPPKS